MDSLMRSLSIAQRLPIVLSRPLSLWPSHCFINSWTPLWCCWTQKKQREKPCDGGKVPERWKLTPKQDCNISRKVFYVLLNLIGYFFVFCMSLSQTGVLGFDISGFAVRPWNTTPDLTALSTVKTRALCYSSSDYFISKSCTINHHPLLEKYNAYTQTEACNQSFTVTGTGGFQRVNRGEPNDTVVSKLRLCLENPMRCLYLCWAVRKGDKANVVMMTIVVLSLKHGVWLDPSYCLFDVYYELQTIPQWFWNPAALHGWRDVYQKTRDHGGLF